MKPTQEQAIAWAREAGVHEQWFKGGDCPPIVFRLAAVAYEAGRKDEALQRLNKAAEDNGEEL